MCHKVSLVFSIKLDVSGEEDLQYLFRSLNVTLICIRCSKTAARPAVSWTQMSLYHKTFKCNFQFVQVRTTLLPVFVFIKCISVIIQNINDPNLRGFFWPHCSKPLSIFKWLLEDLWQCQCVDETFDWFDVCAEYLWCVPPDLWNYMK